jgi:hypothetical protein
MVVSGNSPLVFASAENANRVAIELVEGQVSADCSHPNTAQKSTRSAHSRRAVMQRRAAI